MSTTDNGTRRHLENAIAALEAQRAALGDDAEYTAMGDTVTWQPVWRAPRPSAAY